MEQYLFYDAEVLPGDPVVITAGITLGATDVIRAYVDAADISINVFGTEIA